VAAGAHPLFDCQSPCPSAKALSALRFLLSVFIFAFASASCRLFCMHQDALETKRQWQLRMQLRLQYTA
jgi:hypothetical protein